MNKVVLIGRISKDFELKFIPNSGTATCTINLAIDKYNTKTKQKEADFINVVLWGKNAENTAQYMSKGSEMAVNGKIQTRSYDAKDGSKRYVTEVVATEVQFLSKGQGNKQQVEVPTDPWSGENFEDGELVVDNSDSDMPF